MDGLEPIHEAQERDRKDLLQPRLVPLKPNPDHHRTNDSSAIELTAGRSVRKRARARSRSAQIVENPPCSRSGRLKDRWLLSAALCDLRSAAEKRPRKKAPSSARLSYSKTKQPMSLAALRYCLQWFRLHIRRSVPGKGGVTWFLRIYGGGRRGFT